MMKKIFLFAASLVLLAGCSKEGTGLQPGDGQVELQVSGSALDIAPQKAVTKVGDPMPIGCELGVYGVNITAGEALATTPATTANKKYIVTNDGGTAKITGGPILLATGAQYDFYSYSPYTATIGNVAAIPFNLGQDVLWAKASIGKVDNATSVGRTADFTYTHKMSQVAFVVEFDPSFISHVGATAAGSAIRVTGFSTGGTMDLSTGILTSTGGVAGVIDTQKPTCILPTTGPISLNFVVTVSDGNDGVTNAKTFKGAGDYTFAVGTSYTFKVKVVDNVLVIRGGITAWTPVVVDDDIIVQQ